MLNSPFFLETTSIYVKLLLQMLLIYICVLIQTCTPVSVRVCVVSVCWVSMAVMCTDGQPSEVCCCSHLSRTVKACLCRSAWDWIFLKHTDSLTSRFYVQPIFTNSPSLQHAFLLNWMRLSLHSSESLRDWQETPTWMHKFKEGDTRKSCCESGTGGGTRKSTKPKWGTWNPVWIREGVKHSNSTLNESEEESIEFQV